VRATGVGNPAMISYLYWLAFVKRLRHGDGDVGALRQHGDCPDLQHCGGPVFGVTCDFQALPSDQFVFVDVLEKSHCPGYSTEVILL
jgi:hypothetical protein